MKEFLKFIAGVFLVTLGLILLFVWAIAIIDLVLWLVRLLHLMPG